MRSAGEDWLPAPAEVLRLAGPLLSRKPFCCCAALRLFAGSSSLRPWACCGPRPRPWLPTRACSSGGGGRMRRCAGRGTLAAWHEIGAGMADGPRVVLHRVVGSPTHPPHTCALSPSPAFAAPVQVQDTPGAGGTRLGGGQLGLVASRQGWPRGGGGQEGEEDDEYDLEDSFLARGGLCFLLCVCVCVIALSRSHRSSPRSTRPGQDALPRGLKAWLAAWGAAGATDLLRSPTVAAAAAATLCRCRCHRVGAGQRGVVA